MQIYFLSSHKDQLTSSGVNLKSWERIRRFIFTYNLGNGVCKLFTKELFKNSNTLANSSQQLSLTEELRVHAVFKQFMSIFCKSQKCFSETQIMVRFSWKLFLLFLCNSIQISIVIGFDLEKMYGGEGRFRPPPPPLMRDISVSSHCST